VCVCVCVCVRAWGCEPGPVQPPSTLGDNTVLGDASCDQLGHATHISEAAGDQHGGTPSSVIAVPMVALPVIT